MPEKRMFTKKITESDAFLDMPLSSQCLYFHLNMNADDDGFVNNPRRIMRTIGASEDDLKILIAKAFVLTFESGVIVIKHWRMHNTLQNDRYRQTDYAEERALLDVKKNKAYTWKQNGNILETEPNLDKPNLDKPNIYSDIDDRSDAFKEAFMEFADIRKRMKKPLTKKSVKRTLNALDKLSNDEQTQIQILEQSSYNYWQGVYPLGHTSSRKPEELKSSERYKEEW